MTAFPLTDVMQLKRNFFVCKCISHFFWTHWGFIICGNQKHSPYVVEKSIKIYYNVIIIRSVSTQVLENVLSADTQ